MEPKETTPYYENAAIVGAVTAVAASLVLYGSLLLAPGSVAGIIVGCLGCCGLVLAPGLIITRLQVKQTGRSLELGQGAAMGFMTGAVFAIIFASMEFVWMLFSVDINALYFDSMIAFIEQYGEQEAVRQIEEMREQSESASGFSIVNTILSLLVIGVLNMLTGMAGTGLFKGEDDIDV
jgi:hypothetical protein